MKKHITAVFMAVVMFGLLLVPAFAENTEIIIYGTDEYTKNFGYNEEPYKPRDSKDGDTGNELANGKNVKIYSAGTGDIPAEGLKLSYIFDIAEYGIYELEISGSAYNNAPWFSTYAVSVDSSEPITINGGVITSTADGSGNYIKVYDTSISFELSEGEHIFNFTVINGCSSRNGQAYAFFEYAKLIKKDMSEYASLMINASSSHTSNISELSAEYGVGEYGDHAANEINNGKTVKIQGKAYPEEGIILTYEFDVLIPGIYSMAVSCSKYNLGYLSKWAVSVDEGEYLDINADSVLSMEEHASGGDYTRMLGIHKLDGKYEFDAGKHTVSAKVTGLRDNGDIYTFLEYINFTLCENIDTVTVEDIYAEIGEETNVKLSATGEYTGKELDVAVLSPSYSIEDETVATVTGDGVVTPVNFGNTKLTVTLISEDGSEKKAQAEVFVTVDGIYCGEVKYFNAQNEECKTLKSEYTEINAKAEIFNNTAQEKKITAILAMYEGEVLEKYQKLAEISLPSGTTPLYISLEDISVTDKSVIKLYLWNNLDEGSPIYKAEELN